MPHSETAAILSPLARYCRPWLRAAAWGCGTGLLLAVGIESVRVLVGRNLHAVVPGRVYRCAQQSPTGLERLVREHGIRTVLNLRGCCYPFPWYVGEARATQQLDVAQEDVCLSSGRLPSVTEMRYLVQVLDRTEYPVLIHCRRGADRTGLVSALVLLLYTDTGLAEARRQLGPRYGHVALGKPAYLDGFLDLYAEWLGVHGVRHSPLAFRRWIEQDYCPGECRVVLEPLDLPDSLPLGRPAAIRIRAHNTSVRTWRLRPGSNAGVHAAFVIGDSQARCVAAGKAGLFDAEVAPGESIDLKLALPAVHTPGHYYLVVDMVDEQQGWFYQLGSQPLHRELDVR
jgi:protein tyrosine phosphatase (PTP) superfamily phosphohydrolase (DUF442 family)